MSGMREAAKQFVDACETGQGWEGCRQYCHDDATFTAQAESLDEVRTVEAYTEYMRALFSLLPDGKYELRSMGVDEDRGIVSAFSVFRGTHTGDGGPGPPTHKRAEAEYVYVMEFDSDRIRHMTKVWNDVHTMRQLGWA
jgi:predicted ester cyclase